MQFSYRLTGTGWAEARVSDEHHSVVLTASYLSDSLGELLLAIATLQDGDTSAVCSWQEEPGEYRWLFSTDGDVVTIKVLAFPDWWPPRPDEEGVVVFTTKQHLNGIATAIVAGSRAVLEEWGEEGYLAKWVDFPFPTGLLELIEAKTAGA